METQMYPPAIAPIIEDLTRLGQPPADWLLEKVRDGAIPDGAFRAIVGIRPASPRFDKPGEYWRPVPDWPPYDVSNLARVRSYHAGLRDQLSEAPHCFLHKRWTPGLDEPGVLLHYKGRKEPITPEALARRVFGPLWQPRPKLQPLDPNPPGETWRRVPGWPAYEVSPTGLVRSYHVPRQELAAEPQRLLRHVIDPEKGPSVTLCDGNGVRKAITVEELVRLVYPKTKTIADVGPGSIIAFRGGSSAQDRPAPIGPTLPSIGSGQPAESSPPQRATSFDEMFAELIRNHKR